MPYVIFVAASLAIAVPTVLACLVLSERPWLLAIGVGLGAIGLLIFHAVFFDFYADDAYITLRYSRHLADGLGPNWNSTGRVEGYTNFLWMGVLAGLGRLGLDIVDASRALGFLSLLATFGFVFFIWRLWSDEEPESGLDSPVVLGAALVGLALTDGVTFWGFSGMETPLFGALLTGGAYFYMRERRGAPLPLSAMVFAAAAMTRPEGLLAAAVTGAFLAGEAIRSTDREAAIQRVAVWATVFLLLYGIYFAWRYSYYGELLPNTFYAKVETTRAVLSRGLGYVTGFGLQYQLLAMILGILVLLATRLRTDAAYVLSIGGLMLLGVVIEGGDAFSHGRFVVPLLPLLYVAGVAGFAVLLRRARLQPVHTASLASVALLLAGLSLLPSNNDPALARERAAHDERRLIGEWLNEHTPPDYTIAAFAVGAMSYYAHERDFLDLLGLNDTVIARTDTPDVGHGIIGHERYNIDYVLDDVLPELIVPNDASLTPATTEDFRRRMSVRGPVEARNALFNDARLWFTYEVRSVRIEDKWFNFLQRADTVAELQGPGLQ